MRKKCQELIELGKKVELDKDNAKLASGWWARRKANSSLSSEINKFMAGVHALEKVSSPLTLFHVIRITRCTRLKKTL
jgi:hypothetical protein